MNKNGSTNRFFLNGSNGKWSPDGSKIAFIKKGEPNGTQIFIKYLGVEGEPTQITKLEKSPSSMEWSPDGKFIAFLMHVSSEAALDPIGVPERPKGATWTKGPQVIDQVDYSQDRVGFLERGFRQIFVVPSEGGTARQITFGEFDDISGGISWLKDSESIVFSSYQKEDAEYARGQSNLYSVNINNLPDLLGVPIYQRLEIEKEDLVGITTGLAWTEVGGELLSIEAVKVKGKGKVTATGKLGDVMKESVQAAEFYIRSKAFSFGLDPFDIEKLDVHVHVPEGATPKDGPSAGVAMVTSIVSALTDIKVKNSVGMTGEITLRGRVLPIGGLKEKLLAAKRGGIKTVLIPEDNKKDLIEIPDNIKNKLKIIPVSSIDEVITNALVDAPQELSMLEPSKIAKNESNNPDKTSISH